MRGGGALSRDGRGVVACVYAHGMGGSNTTQHDYIYIYIYISRAAFGSFLERIVHVPLDGLPGTEHWVCASYIYIYIYIYIYMGVCDI